MNHLLAGFPGAELAILAMALAWGATLGSFINVVVHRVPRGRSVVGGASRCPACGAPILPRDNIPVLGWLLLRGRCRACAAAISSRYPLVEAACGGIAAAVAAVEVLGGGRSLPWLGTNGWPGVDRLLMHGDFRLLASWALHTGVLLTIVAWSLLGTSHRVSTVSACVAILIVVAAVVAGPAIGPPGIRLDGARWPDEPRAAAGAAAAVGILVGWWAGGIAGGLNDRCSLALLGAAVGWQTVTIVAVVTIAVRIVVGRRSQAEGPWDPLPGIATAAVVAWEPLRRAIMLSWSAQGLG